MIDYLFEGLKYCPSVTTYSLKGSHNSFPVHQKYRKKKRERRKKKEKRKEKEERKGNLRTYIHTNIAQIHHCLMNFIDGLTKT